MEIRLRLDGQPDRRQTNNGYAKGHPRQCQSKSRVTRDQCGNLSCRGSNYCRFHGGKRALAQQFKKGRYKLDGFYSKHLGPKLSEYVNESLNEPHDEQVSLYQELAICRASACEALKLSQPMFDPEMSAKLDNETKALMVETMGTAMSTVKDLVVAAARLEKESKDKVSLKVINRIVGNIILAVRDICGDEHNDIAEAIAARIDERVRIPINNRVDPEIRIDFDGD